MISQTLEALASILEYPGAEYGRLVENCSVIAATGLEGAGKEKTHALMGDFRKGIEGRSLDELEELYTRTFDLNPVCSLDLGWHLYAENYDRGTFLVAMREALRKYGIPETNELPDHLPSVLKLLARMPQDEASALVEESVLPALKKMIAGFGESENPFGLLIKAVEVILLEAYHHETGVTHHG